ncbi:MAG TPA: hypothetical protein VG713_12930, partial [Pirellulales bacterium]|nr:hypothetical protein [Pirellulales bacterium]
MPIERVFLDPHRPALAQAVELLIARSRSAAEIDLSDHLVVLPGGHAGRRLEEILVDAAAERGAPLSPPQIITVGQLPEQLYQPSLPFADDSTQQLVWIEAVRAMPRDRLARFFPVLPDDGDLVAWMPVAIMFIRLHSELAAQLLDFAAVARLGNKLDGFNEQQRWQTLAEVQRRYLDRLSEVGLCDKQTSRRRAIDERACKTDRRIVLIAAVDLNRAQRAILDQVADQVTALVFAPQAWSARFDAHGCVIPSAWCDCSIELPDEAIEQCDGPGNQSDAVLRAIASFDGRWASDEITLGVVDERLVTSLEQRLEQCGLRPRWGAGVPIAQTAPYRLIKAAAEFVGQRRFAAFAALVRHPAVAAWIDRQKLPADWITQLDRWYADHLPLAVVSPKATAQGPISPAYAIERELSRALRDFLGPERRWNEWAEPIGELLIACFGAQPLDLGKPDERTIVEACDAIGGCLQRLVRVHPQVAPRISGADALRLLLRGLQDEHVAPPADRDALEMLGWLELVLDDAPALVMAGFNEELVPTCRGGDQFLPNALRRELGIDDNDCCYARDAYSLAMIASSRAALRVVFGRRTAAGDPLRPSRLLLACDESKMAERARRWFSPAEHASRMVLAGDLRPGRATADFPVPRPQPLPEPVTSMSVSEFRDYLACPYRYYLRHRLRLEAI